MTAAIPLGDGRFTVPGNRWDLLAGLAVPMVTVAVVIPYYNQQHELDLVLTALNNQDYPDDLIHIVVADDGSAHAPTTSATRLPITVVRQQDRGFRAAAARNLGAATATAEVLCFLDADTIPKSDYLRHLVSLPALCPDALVVGRRRHADFTGWTPRRLSEWLHGGDPPAELPEPRWLAEGYARSGDLLELSHTSYRYVISSVMCCGAELFRDIGGFDESFHQYGGEDWELAHRAIVGGAVLQHAPAAVAWHMGPDWAAREIADRARQKNAETLAVAHLVPDPDLRTPGLVNAIPAVAVEIDARGHGPGSLLATIGCFLGLDVGIWVCGPDANSLLAELRLGDPRVHAGATPEAILRRCRHVVSVTGRAVLPRSAVAEVLRRGDEPGVVVVRAGSGPATVTCSASWARSRARRRRPARGRRDAFDNLASFGQIVELSGQTMGLRSVAPDHPC